MANVSIKFNNKEFLLSCEDGQEDHLEELLIHINQKFNDLKNDLGNLGENKLLLITAVKIMDEYYETKKKVDQKKNELRDLSNKFKELKSLIYDYRDKKEEEIQKLNSSHQNFKNEIEANQKKYEKLIDEAADEISNFVEKAKLEIFFANKKSFFVSIANSDPFPFIILIFTPFSKNLKISISSKFSIFVFVLFFPNFRSIFLVKP